MAEADIAAPDKSFCFHFLSLQKFRKQFCRLGKNHLLAASPLEDSAGTAMLALLQSSSPLLWTSFRKEGNGLPQADFICHTTSFGLRILKLMVGKIPDIQSKKHQWWFTSVLWLTRCSSQRYSWGPCGTGRHEVKYTKLTFPNSYTLASLPLMEQTLDYLQYKASG